MNLSEIYEITDIKGVITIDDEWHFEYKAESILFDLFRMPDEDVDMFFQLIASKNKEIFEKISNARKALKKQQFECRGKAVGQIYRYITDDQTLKIIKGFTDRDVEVIKSETEQFGLGLAEKGVVSLSDFIIAARSNKIPIRVYTDFLDSDMDSINNSIQKLTQSGGYVLCLIDDNLNGSYRANEIINYLQNSKINNRISCVLVTSSVSQEQFNNKIFIEYVQKGEDTNDKIKAAYVKSLYRIMLNNLQKAKIESLNAAFCEAYQNQNIATFLSEMAKYEGVLNFDVILKWLEVKENQYIETKQREMIKKFITYSSIINSIESKSVEFDPGKNVCDIEMYENDIYDLTINELYKPIDVGDIFLIEGKYYILLGQQCDLAIRQKGKRKARTFEFVHAEIEDKQLINKEDRMGYDCAVINYFPLEPNKMLKIDCTHCYFGKPEIFDLCAFNDEGEARISLNEGLPNKVKALMHSGMHELYKAIQDTYKKIINFKAIEFNEEQERVSKSFLDTLKDESQIVDVYSFLNEDGYIHYNIKRVARLKKHANILYKLYLNYRGREAEEAVFFSKFDDILYTMNSHAFNGFCLVSSKNRDGNDLCKIDWWIKREDLNRCLEELGIEANNDDDSEYIRLEHKEKAFNKFKCRKSYDLTNNKYVVEIIKIS